MNFTGNKQEIPVQNSNKIQFIEFKTGESQKSSAHRRGLRSKGYIVRLGCLRLLGYKIETVLVV